MDEIELKFLEIDKKEYISKLEKLGAKKKFSSKVEAIYFDTKKKELKKQNKILRLRKINNKNELTIKTKIKNDQIKHMEEYETNVNDFKLMQKILENLGYEAYAKIIKERISYKYKNCNIEIDTITNCPTYLEIETTDINKLKKIINELGLNIKQGKPWSMFEIIKNYSQRHSVQSP